MSRISRKIGWLALGLIACAQTGCMLALAGAAAGAGAAGYVYYNGLLYRDYHANLGDSVAALRTSLLELQFPLINEKNDTGSAYVQTQTGDGQTVRIYLDTIPSPIPSEGSLTRISVRVGFSGDEQVSGRILNQVSKHLIRPASTPTTSQGVASPILPATNQPPVVGQPQTTPPPLASDRLRPVAATEKR